ncbi:PLP-dependent aminotransferase family protein [Roseovarius sp. C7]|uniref:MocR-like pyridoxine biosynthesis transcription factor PdxR n=1 Tax=Roseovarius sp. C7 TaxID=3398643 RepID=UPI0039F69358
MSSIDKKSQSNLTRPGFEAALFALTLDRALPSPLHVQLCDGLRALLLRGGDLAGLALPPSRLLAAELSVSRMTVTTAYDQLTAEGYLTARRGSGTFVAADLPHLAPAPAPTAQPAPPPADWQLFQTGLPDQALFPHRQWARQMDRAWRAPEPALLGRPDPFGWMPLRRAIAAHLGAWRGLECRGEQVVITGGAWDGVDILTRALFSGPQQIALEDPGWASLHHAVRDAGHSPLPLRIDADGFDPAQIPAGTAAAIVTPSRHYPTGRPMPLPRRLALLDWAQATGALVVEDDYDSEFRYQGQPLPALTGLDQQGRTIYMGSFSKLLSSALRLGYLVLPEGGIAAVRAYLERRGARASLAPQPALAGFMDSGDFATHLRRMRRSYARRQTVLLEALTPLSAWLDLSPDPSGMHLCLPLRPALLRHTTDAAISEAGRATGLRIGALSRHAVLPDALQALLLGYSGFDEDRLRQGAARLCDLIETLTRTGSEARQSPRPPARDG